MAKQGQVEEDNLVMMVLASLPTDEFASDSVWLCTRRLVRAIAFSQYVSHQPLAGNIIGTNNLCLCSFSTHFKIQENVEWKRDAIAFLLRKTAAVGGPLRVKTVAEYIEEFGRAATWAPLLRVASASGSTEPAELITKVLEEIFDWQAAAICWKNASERKEVPAKAIRTLRQWFEDPSSKKPSMTPSLKLLAGAILRECLVQPGCIVEKTTRETVLTAVKGQAKIAKDRYDYQPTLPDWRLISSSGSLNPAEPGTKPAGEVVVLKPIQATEAVAEEQAATVQQVNGDIEAAETIAAAAVIVEKVKANAATEETKTDIVVAQAETDHVELVRHNALVQQRKDSEAELVKERQSFDVETTVVVHGSTAEDAVSESLSSPDGFDESESTDGTSAPHRLLLNDDLGQKCSSALGSVLAENGSDISDSVGKEIRSPGDNTTTDNNGMDWGDEADEADEAHLEQVVMREREALEKAKQEQEIRDAARKDALDRGIDIPIEYLGPEDDPPLESPWTLWQLDNSLNLDKSMTSDQHYAASIVSKVKFNSIKGFWSMFRNLRKTQLGGDRYMLMKNQLKPLWETTELRKCGRIKFRVKKTSSASFLDIALITAVGETMSAAIAPMDDIVGIEWGGDSRKQSPEDNFALWHKYGTESLSTMTAVRRFFGTFCDIESVTPFRHELCPMNRH